MRRKILYFTIALVALCGVSSISAQVAQSYSVPSAEDKISSMSNSELWNKANTAYANDNYIRAEKLYREILNRDLESAELLYNLGNVHHKRGDVGLSLLYYYKALKLSPSDGDILHNIEVVRAKTKDNIEQMPRLFLVEWSEWIGSRFSCAEWSVLSLVFLVVALGGVLLYLLTSSLKMRRLGFGVLFFVGILFVLTTRHALIERAELINPSEAVVMSKSASITSSPSRGATELFILHEGTKVRVITSHDNWFEIMIDDGKKGWIESSRVEVI